MQSEAARALLHEPYNYTDGELQSAHAPAARVIYKPSRYGFNTELFIIIKRLKAFTLACPPPSSTAADGVVQLVKVTQPFTAPNPPCDPSRGTAACAQLPRAPLETGLLALLKPASLVQRNNTEDSSEAVFLSHDIKTNLRWIQTMFKYLHLFFHHCSSIFRFYH